MDVFKLDAMRSVELSDCAVLTPLILSLEPCTCEMNFLNLYTWEHSYDTKWCLLEGLPVFWFQTIDLVLFPGGRNPDKMPSPELLQRISRTMKDAGHSGTITQVPEEYFLKYPEIEETFRKEQVTEDIGEYYYTIDNLIGLHGSKLAKKKNLIRQFERLYPDYEVRPYSMKEMPACRRLSHNWAEKHGEKGGILEEEDALLRTYASTETLGVEGVCLYVSGKLIAFSLYSRLDSGTCDEHYEKTDPEYKGASQMINFLAMRAMREKYEFVNREQDLGIEGLRHAKLSYSPDSILRNWNLILKD